MTLQELLEQIAGTSAMGGPVSKTGFAPTVNIAEEPKKKKKKNKYDDDLKDACWPGYKAVGLKKKNGKMVPNCVPENESFEDKLNRELFAEAEYQGRKVELEKPFRTPDGPKKFSVYVRNKKGNVIKVNFGDPDMEIKRDDPESRASFRARHKCDQEKDKTTARYWSCKMWEKGKSVSDITS